MDTWPVEKKLLLSIIIILLALLLWLVGSFSVNYISSENNRLRSGNIQIDLNGGQPIVRPYELLFQPGSTIQKDFFIENNGTRGICYRLYLDRISGQLADVVVISIYDGDKTLYSGTARELSGKNTSAVDQILEAGQRKALTISFCVPKECNNDIQNLTLNFVLRAEATQVKEHRNPFR